MLPTIGFLTLWALIGAIIACVFSACELATLGPVATEFMFGETMAAGGACGFLISVCIMLAALGQDHGDR